MPFLPLIGYRLAVFGVSYFTDHNALLKEGLDAVSVCVPTEHHAQVALDAIHAGVSVLVEKPLAPSATEAESIVTAARSAGVVLAAVPLVGNAASVRLLPASAARGSCCQISSVTNGMNG